MFQLIDICDYDSPLDLLYQLIELNRADIYHIPIADISEQYLAVLRRHSAELIDLELASEFLLMAATLMQIKSRLLLPKDETKDADDGADPREELVLRLLAYRRNKQLARELEKRLTQYQNAYLKAPSSPAKLGLTVEIIEDPISQEKFQRAVERLDSRNRLRFNDQNLRIRQLLRREKFSVTAMMKDIVQRVLKQPRMFFNELFPLAQTSKAERVTGFLAVLELIRQNRIVVKQPNPFAVILIEREKNRMPEETAK